METKFESQIRFDWRSIAPIDSTARHGGDQRIFDGRANRLDDRAQSRRRQLAKEKEPGEKARWYRRLAGEFFYCLEGARYLAHPIPDAG